jgi:threonine/homoserine/homoserine lactone efflux protein
MTTYGLPPFIAVFSLAVALPGPGVAVILARGLTRSAAGTYAFIAGITVADLVWFTCAASGLAALAQNAYNLNRSPGAVMAGAAVMVAVR